MTAPYAATPIPLSLSSVTGLKYRTLNCMECGHPFLERNSDRMFRIGSADQPDEAHLGADGTVTCICGNCTQKYSVTLTLTMNTQTQGVPLYMQPQALFMAVEPVKKFRDTYCLECGKAFYSISDRIKLLVDNVPPAELQNPDKLGPMEVWCKFHHCRQRWAVLA